LQHFEQSTPSLIDPGHPPPLSQVKVVEIPSHPVQSFAPTLPMTIALDMVTQYAIKKADRKTTNARFIVTPPNVSAFQSCRVHPANQPENVLKPTHQIVPPPPQHMSIIWIIDFWRPVAMKS
jgi:hypothetical protein